MKHATDEICVDFARGLLASDQLVELQEHIDSNCARCLRLRDLWQSIIESARRERAYQPPEAAVRTAKAAYSTRFPTPFVNKMAKYLPLLFDSFVDSPLAAVRGSSVPPGLARDLKYGAGPWTIDLRLEFDESRMIIAGQVRESNQTADETLAATVLVACGGSVLSETPSNSFGEFQVECKCEVNLQIFVDIHGRQTVAIVLPAADV